MLDTLWQQVLPIFTEEFWAEPLRAPMISRSCRHLVWGISVICNTLGVANLAVQVFVHAYFAAAEFAVTKRLFTFLRSYITLLQLSQMFFGMCISSHAIYHPEVQQSALAVFNAKLCLAMYISHAILFLQFYLDAFCKEYRSGEATFLTFFHAFAVIGLVKLVMHEQCWRLFADTLLLYLVGGLGITCGSHRLWSHRAYKASAGLRCFLMLLTSLANQGSIFHWARDHRVHHKNSDKEGDPYNASRGFFYSHVGWLLLKKPQSVKDAGSCLRWCICLHATWTVNSTAHIWGDRRYTVEGNPCESCFTALVAVGEGWHDWHHKYPYDYAASEGGIFDQYNPSKLWSLFFDLLLLTGAYLLTWWCYSACTSRLSTAPQALVEASPYVLLPLLLIVSSAVLGTLFFSMLMHAFVAANGTFSASTLLSDLVGGLICGLLMIPYQRKRFNVPGETPALSSTSPWLVCLFGATILDTLRRLYFDGVVVEGKFVADDVMNNNCKYDFLCVAPCALRWVKACLDKRHRKDESQLMRAIHVLHHRPLDLHLLQAVTFEVPLHRVPEAVCYLNERVESMPAEVFSASLSDGFAVVHPDSRPEYYNSLGQPAQERRAEEPGTSTNGEVDKKAKDLDEAPFGASSSTLTKRTRAVGS
ncbi:fatty acyl-CoA desaturase, putative [Eimeria maxima]|uniref:Fatty acyl-CoA desaturase, putative n=1 Tax=Eimeria maxima TaxID=5804 RepID=U6MBS8_EIMMA|nr:fatty acyl-CoA desaturase, putative [Eimeria maxima]CDJ61496.1 fatty acyl-CoA desaturase, putative [Eimeria maxima]